jgi:small-conductance mechanosensitive channel
MSTLRLKLKRVDPVKYATISALLTGLLMLIIFVPMMLLLSLIGAGAATESFGAGAAIFGGGIFMIILIPIFYAVFVFIITLIMTSLLNFILKKTGGLDIDFEKAGLDINRIGE